MGKQLGIGEVKEARPFVRQDIGHARDKVMKWDVVVVSLVDCMEAEEISDWPGCGSRAFALPSYGGGVIGNVVDGVGVNADRLSEDVELSDGGSEF
jgi:hypothetical protein